MHRTIFAAIALSFVAAFTTPSIYAADSVDQYEIWLKGAVQLKGKEINQKVETDTKLRYIWQATGSEKELILNILAGKILVDGKANADNVMMRSQYVDKVSGEKNVIAFENANEYTKKLLEDSFETPIYRITVDENGKESRRDIIAKPGAKLLLDIGVIEHASLMHPPYFKEEKNWQREAEFPLGGGIKATGTLKYNKTTQENNLQKVRVSGLFSNPDYDFPGVAGVKAAINYKVTGEQSLDTQTGVWVDGNLTFRGELTLKMNNTQLATGRGSITVEFHRLDEVKTEP